MNRTAIGLTATAALLLASLTGCATGGGGDTDDEVTIGYAATTLTNPYYNGMIYGLEQGAKEHGFSQVVTNANDDAARQIADMQDLVLKGVDFVFVTPMDTKAMAPAIAAAKAADVPVFSVSDSGPEGAAMSIRSDNTKLGEQQAEAVVAFLTEKNGSPSGKVANIEGTAGIPAAVQRSEGFTNVISQYPEIEVVATADGNFDTAKSNTVFTDILQAHPDVEAVVASNDSSALGVVAAIKNARLDRPIGDDGHIYVIGADGTKPALDAIRAGELDASISQNPITLMEKAVDLAADYKAGKDIPKETIWPTLLIDTENIDSDEVESYGLWGDTVAEAAK